MRLVDLEGKHQVDLEERRQVGSEENHQVDLEEEHQEMAVVCMVEQAVWDNLHTMLKHWEKKNNQEAFKNTLLQREHRENSGDKVLQAHMEKSADMMTDE